MFKCGGHTESNDEACAGAEVGQPSFTKRCQFGTEVGSTEAILPFFELKSVDATEACWQVPTSYGGLNTDARRKIAFKRDPAGKRIRSAAWLAA